MSDERPKPKYGELAPEGWVWQPPQERQPESAPTAPPAPSPTGPASAGPTSLAQQPSRQPASQHWAAPTPGTEVPGAAPAPRRGDRIATMVLLVIGAFWSVNTAFGMFSLPAALQQAMDILGISGTYTAYDTANSAGVTGGVLTLLTFALTVLYSLRRLRANKLAFFIPIIGAVVAFVISIVVYTIAMTADPALMDGLLRTAP
ncbi:DUF6264 family protein [Herbiconiux sp. KACC 21604]|uniref:DUF6264 family protein n=1 Tax=unclassified Herbiconiux TaxID=2618217 RepID=UPI001492FFFD|nr:DUF6264 family protein [Herbiconiux sp. SALV-R1]QJU53967.1 hypothetical protein HL652_10240 [Herbiconiux sp. SALV-R1]WPO84995.1 DUF6264 family protein [Herbiconiux sp. KACC 21604]